MPVPAVMVTSRMGGHAAGPAASQPGPRHPAVTHNAVAGVTRMQPQPSAMLGAFNQQALQRLDDSELDYRSLFGGQGPPGCFNTSNPPVQESIAGQKATTGQTAGQISSLEACYFEGYDTHADLLGLDLQDLNPPVGLCTGVGTEPVGNTEPSTLYQGQYTYI
jgi:hypothetical protein